MKTKNTPPIAVVFFGADGVGKTTQARLLEAAYHSQDYKTRRCWLRARHSLSYILQWILLRLGYPCRIQHGPLEIIDARTLPLKELWSLIEFISVLPWIITRFHLPLKTGHMVIAERYTPDTIIYNSYHIGKEFKPYHRILLRLIPKNTLLIYLDAELEELLSRRSTDWSPDFIKYQLKAYRKLAEKLKATTINTSLYKPQETNKKIRTKVFMYER